MNNNDKGQTPFYQQSNESSSSRLNISRVGFNNLRKWSSSSSTSSSIISNSTSTIKSSNPLTKLFTRTNKSQTSLSVPQQAHTVLSRKDAATAAAAAAIASGGATSTSISDLDSISFYEHGDSLSTIFTQDSKASNASTSTRSKKFRLPRPKLRFSKSGTGSSKPDLTIQTKKIVSTGPIISENQASTNRKNSLSSPVTAFHSIFHRSSTDTSLGKTLEESPSTLVPPQSTTSTKSTARTALCLSSNNSNSYITNVEFASVYKFTDPNYQLDESATSVTASGGGNMDHASSSLAEIHRKLSIPTDSFIQTRLQRYHTHSGHSDDNTIENFRQQNSQFYNQLLTLLRPLFTPSMNKKHKLHPFLGHSLEDIGDFIRLNFFNKQDLPLIGGGSSISGTNTINSTISGTTPNPLKSRNKPIPASASSSTTSFSDDEFTYFKAREISQDLLMFFLKCMNIFKMDYFKTFEDSYSNCSELIRPWMVASKCWVYFNEKIRFYILIVFHRFQTSFNELSAATTITSSSINISAGGNDNSIPSIDVESILLFAFRETIIIPILVDRTERQDEVDVSDEKMLLQENFESLNLLLDCLGALSTPAVLDAAGGGSGGGGTAERGEPSLRSDVVISTLAWLSNIF
ncbi:uncharacterized protein J8A68_001431 [[Candida] subhashii]|uniref:Uncharacterized protein n=1 Tax=[Candida] subhashii TaxID=561895 RepID=A0A8J5QG50_9ASCO|nr:uncharacterized protein J8A68_001431 [[Candida] subhashii]KAG7665024.1 hypothetical protein J8A68_001431 [[Candida] subhashii]